MDKEFFFYALFTIEKLFSKLFSLAELFQDFGTEFLKKYPQG